MSLLNEHSNSYEEFEAERKNTDQILEFIDGIIYMSPSPSIKHQEIASFLHGELYSALRNSKCKVFSAPTDVLFDNEKIDDRKRVVPDLFVTCKSDNLTENELVGPPDFVIEILSPSNKSHDMVTKLNLYMNHGVKEYWIVDPMNERILIYYLDENDDIQFNLAELGRNVKSRMFKEFEIRTDDLFG